MPRPVPAEETGARKQKVTRSSKFSAEFLQKTYGFLARRHFNKQRSNFRTLQLIFECQPTISAKPA